jgi:hypothetical protein
MNKLLVIAAALALTSCAHIQENLRKGRETPEITLPPRPNTANIQDWEPKGCDVIDESMATQSCEYMDKAVCAKKLDSNLADTTVLHKGTHFWVREQGDDFNKGIYKKGVIYNCTKFVNEKQKQKPGAK